MKVYLDVCCLNRPFDDQSQPRVHFETEAILLVLEKIARGDWKWISSEMVLYEASRNPNLEVRERILLLTSYVNEIVEVTPEILRRAEELEGSGFDAYDAVHLASAEDVGSDIFLTTDDQLLKIANKKRKLLRMRAENPVKWLEEILK